jgi:hypothetical protein
VHEYDEDDIVPSTGEYEFRAKRTGELTLSKRVVIIILKTAGGFPNRCITLLMMRITYFRKNSAHSIDNYCLTAN